MPSSDMSAWMAEIERRLYDAEVTARANQTSIRDGFLQVRPREGPAMIRLGGDTDDENVTLTVVDTSGRDAIVIGTRSDGVAYIRVNNADDTAPAFEITNGVGAFPLAASAWQPSYWPGIVSMDAYGRQETTATFAAYSVFSVTLSLTTPKVRVQLSPECLGSVTEGRFRFWASVAQGDPRFNSHTVATVDEITFDATYPNVQTVVLDIPSSILPDPAEDVVGTLVTLDVLCWASAGSGSIAVAPPSPAYCVPV